MSAAKPISELSLTPSRVQRLLWGCEEGRCEDVESVLGEGVTQEDRTALANWKSKETGFTPLHIVCHHGHGQCIPALLKQKADAHIWDHCGFAPIHCAARANHRDCVTLLLQSGACEVNEETQFGENPFLIACLNGSYDVARSLYEEFECGVPAVDSRGYSVLHYATASDSAELLLWVLSIHDIKVLIDSPNNSGHTPLHHACVLGCANSLSALLHHDARVSYTLTPSHPHTLSLSQLSFQYGNRRCYEIVENSATPPPLPRASTTVSSLYRQGSQVSEEQPKQSQPPSLPPPLRSNSSGSRGSRQSLLSTTSTHQRRGSLVAGGRPVTLQLRRSSSLRRGSSESLLQSRISATRLSQSLSRLSSSSLEQLLYDSTAYEPPPDILFTPPVERKVLTSRTQKVYSAEHGLKLRVSHNYWTGENKSHGLHVCMCAAMHYSQTFPEGYVVVSPICFLSCRSRGTCQVSLSLPHSVDMEGQPLSRLVILSSATARTDADPNSPLFSPSERILAPVVVTGLKIHRDYVTFHTELSHPSLFVVAVSDSGPGSIPLPLRCCLYVLYPGIVPSANMVAGFDVETYVGMNLQTVATAIMSWAEKYEQKLEEAHFVMSGEPVVVSSDLLPDTQTDWQVDCRGNGEFKYTQVALTQHTDRDVYSHQLVYPRRERFFIEPRTAASAVKCRISVSSSISELCALMVIPYSPRKETTPDLSSPEHRYSISSHQRPPALRRHSLPSSSSSYAASLRLSPVHSPSHFPQVLLSFPSTASNNTLPLPHSSHHSASAIPDRSPSTTSGAIPDRSPSTTSAATTSATVPDRSPSTTSATTTSATVPDRSPSTTSGAIPDRSPSTTSGTIPDRSPSTTSATIPDNSPTPTTTSTIPDRSSLPATASTTVPDRSPPRPSASTIPNRSPILYLPNGDRHHSESQV